MFRGEDGIVYIKIHGIWTAIGQVDIVEVEVDSNASEEEVLEAAKDVAQKDFKSITEVDIEPDDENGMYEFVYYQWLATSFPTLYWN